MKEFMPLVFTILAIVLVSGVSVWLVETSSDQGSSGDLTGAISMRDILKKHKPKIVITPPPAGPSCGSLGGTQCLNKRAGCSAGLTGLGTTYDCTFMCCGPQKPAAKPSTPPAAQPSPAPAPSSPSPAAPSPAKPSCAEVTKGKGTCTRYCDRGRNSLDVEYSRGDCGGGSNVCCVKNELSDLPDDQLTCAQARAKYHGENEWCQQQAPCKGKTIPTLPRNVGKTLDCPVCCLETARTG